MGGGSNAWAPTFHRWTTLAPALNGRTTRCPLRRLLSSLMHSLPFLQAPKPNVSLMPLSSRHNPPIPTAGSSEGAISHWGPPSLTAGAYNLLSCTAVVVHCHRQCLLARNARQGHRALGTGPTNPPWHKAPLPMRLERLGHDTPPTRPPPCPLPERPGGPCLGVPAMLLPSQPCGRQLRQGGRQGIHSTCPR